VKIATTSDEFKKQVVHSHGCHYVIEHLPISLLADDSTVEFLEEPGKFLLKVALESRLTPLNVQLSSHGAKRNIAEL